MAAAACCTRYLRQGRGGLVRRPLCALRAAACCRSGSVCGRRGHGLFVSSPRTAMGSRRARAAALACAALDPWSIQASTLVQDPSRCSQATPRALSPTSRWGPSSVERSPGRPPRGPARRPLSAHALEEPAVRQMGVRPCTSARGSDASRITPHGHRTAPRTSSGRLIWRCRMRMLPEWLL
jgi:hypothetical protein